MWHHPHVLPNINVWKWNERNVDVGDCQPGSADDQVIGGVLDFLLSPTIIVHMSSGTELILSMNRDSDSGVVHLHGYKASKRDVRKLAY